MTSRPLLVTVGPASAAVGVSVGGIAGICTCGGSGGGEVLGDASGICTCGGVLGGASGAYIVLPVGLRCDLLRRISDPLGIVTMYDLGSLVFALTSAGIQVFTWGWYTPTGCPGRSSLKFLEAFLSWWYFCTFWRWISCSWSGSFTCEHWMRPLDGNCVRYSRWFSSLAGAGSFVSIGVTQCDNQARYGSWPDASAFLRKALSVCTILSTHPLLWGIWVS